MKGARPMMMVLLALGLALYGLVMLRGAVFNSFDEREAVGKVTAVRYQALDPSTAIPADKSRFTEPLLALFASAVIFGIWSISLKLARRRMQPQDD